jgi:signal transduction histidine kinase
MNMISAMGEVAASVAHELNQPLTAVLSNAQAARRLLTANTAGPDELREILDDIIEQDKRAGDVIQGMHRILKKDHFEWAPQDLGAIVTDVVHLLAHQASWHGVLLVTEFSSGRAMVRGDRVQLQQVVLNLVLNGIEASRIDAPARHRSVSITTRVEGHLLRLSVRDSGVGILPGTDTHLFEPFFTTKQDGLGIGLSISRSIVELHHGQILARNLPGGGAEFSVVLPVEEGDAA